MSEDLRHILSGDRLWEVFGPIMAMKHDIEDHVAVKPSGMLLPEKWKPPLPGTYVILGLKVVWAGVEKPSLIYTPGAPYGR